MKLSPEEKKFLIERIAADEALPDDFQEKLFPTEQKEYELRYGGKMRREDVLADQAGRFRHGLHYRRRNKIKRRRQRRKQSQIQICQRTFRRTQQTISGKEC